MIDYRKWTIEDLRAELTAIKAVLAIKRAASGHLSKMDRCDHANNNEAARAAA